MGANSRHFFGALAVFLTMWLAATAGGQQAKDKQSKDKAADQPPPTSPEGAKAAAPAAAKGPAAAEYQRLMEEWKTVLKDLRKLKLQFQTAALADQAKIQTEWTALIDKGNETVAALEGA